MVKLDYLHHDATATIYVITFSNIVTHKVTLLTTREVFSQQKYH